MQLDVIVFRPPSLQFVWSVDDSDAPLLEPTLYISSRSLSIRSATEYRFRSTFCSLSDLEVSATIVVVNVAIVVVEPCNTCAKWFHYIGTSIFPVVRDDLRLYCCTLERATEYNRGAFRNNWPQYLHFISVYLV